jgi:hypothetical protein
MSQDELTQNEISRFLELTHALAEARNVIRELEAKEWELDTPRFDAMRSGDTEEVARLDGEIATARTAVNEAGIAKISLQRELDDYPVTMIRVLCRWDGDGDGTLGPLSSWRVGWRDTDKLERLEWGDHDAVSQEEAWAYHRHRQEWWDAWRWVHASNTTDLKERQEWFDKTYGSRYAECLTHLYPVTVLVRSQQVYTLGTMDQVPILRVPGRSILVRRDDVVGTRLWGLDDTVVDGVDGWNQLVHSGKTGGESVVIPLPPPAQPDAHWKIVAAGDIAEGMSKWLKWALDPDTYREVPEEMQAPFELMDELIRRGLGRTPETRARAADKLLTQLRKAEIAMNERNETARELVDMRASRKIDRDRWGRMR